jgi:hypothetical protein
MAIEQVTVPYEILYRLAEDGTVAGCHRRDLEIIRNTETGQVYSAKELDPQPVDGAEMEAVLGVITTAQAATIAQQNTQIADLQNQLSQKSDALSSAENQSEDLTAQLDLANQTIEQKELIIAQLLAQINQ